MSKIMNNKLEFVFNNVLLSFYIEKDGRMFLLYAGKNKEVKSINKYHRSYRNLVEIDTIEDQRNNHHGDKLIESSYGRTYKYVSHQVTRNELGDEIIITTKNEYLTVDIHYQFYDGACGISSFSVVTNNNSNPQTLLSVSSFVFAGFSKANNKNLYLYQADNSWHCEAQWKKDSFLHLGIYNGNDYFSNKRYSINNKGSWSTKDHLPMMAIENKLKKEVSLIQIESNGSWNLEISDVSNHLYYLASGPEFKDHAWQKMLNVNESFTSVQATIVFGNDFEQTIQEITKIRRKYRRFSKDYENMPVIFNDYMHALWDKQTTKDILPLVDIASSVGCETFCIDAGWFEEGNDWWDVLGKWEVHEPNFPNGGLEAVCNYIRNKGMVAGLWLEPEAVGINSTFGKQLPDEYFFMINGHRAVTARRYMLNFANPNVYSYMLDTVKNLVTRFNLGYLKFDYNTDIGLGNEYNSDSLGDGLLKHNRAYIKWLNEIMDTFPDLTIENCASGGCRMDNEILKVCSIQSTSDQTNFKKYPYLSTNVLTATTPEQAAVWSYPVNAYIKNYMPTDEEVIMNMCNAMLGRIHLASFINKLPSNQLDLIREGNDYFKSIKLFKLNSLPIYPKGTSLFFDKEVIGGLINNDKAILGVWNTSGKAKSIKVNLAKYNVTDLCIGYPKSTVIDYTFDKASKTLVVNFKAKYGARVFELKIDTNPKSTQKIKKK